VGERGLAIQTGNWDLQCQRPFLQLFCGKNGRSDGVCLAANSRSYGDGRGWVCPLRGVYSASWSSHALCFLINDVFSTKFHLFLQGPGYAEMLYRRKAQHDAAGRFEN